MNLLALALRRGAWEEEEKEEEEEEEEEEEGHVGITWLLGLSSVQLSCSQTPLSPSSLFMWPTAAAANRSTKSSGDFTTKIINITFLCNVLYNPVKI